jgi:hypothetical protein
LARSPAANAWKKLSIIGGLGAVVTVDVSNGEATDAHIDISVMNPTDGAAFADDGTPPAYSWVHKRIRVPSDGVDGNFWVMPSKSLAVNSVIAVRTDLAGVTFCCHGVTFS